MRYLLDTHILIWYIFDRDKINPHVLDILDDYNNQMNISVESLREIAIKFRNEKFILPVDFKSFLRQIKDKATFRIVGIQPEHLITLSELDNVSNHRDPSDLTIISQAITEKICLVSSDSKMKYYCKHGLELLPN